MSALLALPLARWARRFDRGDVRLRGRVDGAPVELGVPFAAGAVQGDVAALRAVVEGLADPAFDGSAVTERGLLVKVVPGFTVRIAPGTRVTASAAASGPPDAPRLSAPLAIAVDGEGVAVSLLGATLVVRSGTLSPDGAVELRGDGRLAGPVMRLASATLTREIRRGTRFARVRRFLRHS